MALITKDSTFAANVWLIGKLRLFLMFFLLSSAGVGAPMARAQDAPHAAPALTEGVASQTDSAVSLPGGFPDAPSPSNTQPADTPAFPSAMSPKQKIRYATDNAFGIPSLIFAAAGAGVNQTQDLYPEFHQGAEGYGRYYWHSYADQAVDSYFVNFVLAEALHTDPRYHPLLSGGVWARTKHAGASLLLTHTDAGHLTFNTAQVLGSGVAASASSLYYPERDRTASLVTQRWANNLAGDGLMMVLREFTPELISAGRHLCGSISFGDLLCKDRRSAGE
jgi:hypothetical protein